MAIKYVVKNKDKKLKYSKVADGLELKKGSVFKNYQFPVCLEILDIIPKVYDNDDAIAYRTVNLNKDGTIRSFGLRKYENINDFIKQIKYNYKQIDPKSIKDSEVYDDDTAKMKETFEKFYKKSIDIFKKNYKREPSKQELEALRQTAQVTTAMYLGASKKDSAINDDDLDTNYAEVSSEEVAKKGIISELDTTTEYDGLILQLKELYNKTQDEKYLTAANAIEDINKEEYAHAGEFSQILANLNPDISADVQEGMQEVDNEGIEDACSVKDSLGEGKCAPICYDYIKSVNNLIISYNRATDKDSPTSKLVLKQQAGYINEQISKTEFEIKKFDEYWPKHKAEMLDNIQKAKAQLTNFIRQNNIKDKSIEDDCSADKDIDMVDSNINIKQGDVFVNPDKNFGYRVDKIESDHPFPDIIIASTIPLYDPKDRKGYKMNLNRLQFESLVKGYRKVDQKGLNEIYAMKMREKDAAINDINYAEKSLKEPTQPLKDSLPSIEEVKAVLKKTMFSDPRTAVKYVGKISTGGVEKDKFIFGIPGGKTQYAIYFVNGKYDGITRINASSNIKLDSAPELNEDRYELEKEYTETQNTIENDRPSVIEEIQPIVEKQCGHKLEEENDEEAGTEVKDNTDIQDTISLKLVLTGEQEKSLQYYAKQFEYNMADIIKGLEYRINSRRMTVQQAVENIKEAMTSLGKLY